MFVTCVNMDYGYRNAQLKKIMDNVTRMYHKAAKALKRPESAPKYDPSVFEKYPQFVNIRYFLVNFDDLTGPEAISKYVRYMKYLDNAGFVKNKNFILESIRYIKSFCKKQKITVDRYPSFVETGKVTESFWIHLKDRRISPYATMFFPKIVRKILTSDMQEYKYYLERIGEYQQMLFDMNSNETLKKIIQKKLE